MDKYIEETYKQALLAYEIGEIPVGAIIIDQNGIIIGKGYNRKEIDNSVISHAEVNAIIEASKNINNWRLNECTMFVTLEPCDMCKCIINESRIKKVYFILDNNKKSNIKLNFEIKKIEDELIIKKYKELLKNNFIVIRNKDN